MDTQIKSIQVIPTIQYVDMEGDIPAVGVIPQFEGPTDATTDWSIYRRGADGTVEWVADCCDEKTADFLAGAILRDYPIGTVHLEPKLWRKA